MAIIGVVAAGVVLAACARSEQAQEAALSVGDLLAAPSPERQAAAWAEQNQIQESIRQCMARDGFEYIPYAPRPEPTTTGDFAMRATRAAVTARDDEFTRSFGYGFTDAWVSAMKHFANDPNLKLRRDESPEEAEAYDEAWGSCVLAAQEEAGYDAKFASEVGEFYSVLADVDLRILAAAEVANATGPWARCMARAGYRFASPTDAVRHVEAMVNDALSDDFEHGDAEGEQTPQGFPGVPQGFPGVEPDSKTVDETRTKEVEIAVADVECRQTTGLGEVLARVRAEQEKAVEEEYGHILARLLQDG